MKLINSENNKSLIFPNAQSPCAIILINPKGPCIYLLMGFNDYLGPLVNVEGVTLTWMWGVFLPIYINQPLGQSTPKLPYGEPLVWEIPRVVNYIFLLFLSPLLSPSPSPLPLPSCSSYAAEVPLGKTTIQNIFPDFVFFF